MQANLPIYERVLIGKEDEHLQVITLRRNGFIIEDATVTEDMIEKIDRYIVRTDGIREKLQIKGRDITDTSRKVKDLLSDVYEPYCGLAHSLTTPGRDAVSQYDWFTCRIEHNLYLVNGKAHKKIITEALEEWASSEEREFVDKYLSRYVDLLSYRYDGSPIWNKSSIFRHFKAMSSKLYPPTDLHNGVEIRCTQDRCNGRPKLLVFVPPAAFTSKHARIYKMES